MTNIWTKKEKPLLVLAPMAGYTDAAFRLLCREFGADIVMTELVSADAIAYGKLKVIRSKLKINEDYFIFNKCEANKNNNTAELLSFFEEERPVVFQLFGKYPEKFALAAKWVSENIKPDGIDINMGCPARKVVGSDHGAALLKNPDLAVEIVKAVKANTDLPVSVKTRLGWENDDEILDFAPKLAEAGVDAIIVHGRTYKDGFGGTARWENIYKLKEMLGDKVAVIGNGDVDNLKFKIQNLKVRSSILDGVAIGRASFGKPWIFKNNLKFKNLSEPIGSKSRRQNSKLSWSLSGCSIEENSGNIDKNFISGVILRHAALVFATKGERGIIEFRKHLLAYFKGFPHAKEMRQEAVKVKDVKDVEKIIQQLINIK